MTASASPNVPSPNVPSSNRAARDRHRSGPTPTLSRRGRRSFAVRCLHRVLRVLFGRTYVRTIAAPVTAAYRALLRTEHDLYVALSEVRGHDIAWSAFEETLAATVFAGGEFPERVPFPATDRDTLIAKLEEVALDAADAECDWLNVLDMFEHACAVLHAPATLVSDANLFTEAFDRNGNRARPKVLRDLATLNEARTIR